MRVDDYDYVIAKCKCYHDAVVKNVIEWKFWLINSEIRLTKNGFYVYIHWLLEYMWFIREISFKQAPFEWKSSGKRDKPAHMFHVSCG